MVTGERQPVKLIAIRGIVCKSTARSFLSGTVVVLHAALLTIGGALTPPNHASAAEPGKTVIVYYVPWDRDRGYVTIQTNADVITEVSPFAYSLTTSGDIVYDPVGGANVVDNASMDLFRSKGLRVTPVIHNLLNGDWNQNNIVSEVINDPAARATHVRNIVAMVVAEGYDGVTLDYEDLNASDRAAFSSFVTELAGELHAAGRTLAVDVYGKTSEPGSWSGQQAQDYAALGGAADEVRLMFYDYDARVVGPQSPYAWMNHVLTFAKSQMPAAKIIHGIPLFGYDWTEGVQFPSPLTWTDVAALQAHHNPTVNWDPADKVSWFEYSVGTTRHTVWFENAVSTRQKQELADQHGVSGIHMWRLGGEDMATWNADSL